MSEWIAPAKLNLGLRVGPVRGDGLHPLRSIVQTIEWCDHLTVHEGDEDRLVVDGAGLPEGGDNLVWRAVETLELPSRPRLDIHLTKRIAVAAGLGGGSSDAAAALSALADLVGVGPEQVAATAAAVGSDVPFFLVGGTARMEGAGEQITPIESLDPCSVAVVVPPFDLSTPEVYRRWDELGEPRGETVDRFRLPPPLRRFDEIRNDLTPAAVSLRPELGEWMGEVARQWDRPVFMTGSGPACFALFVDDDEASDAASAVPDVRAVVAAAVRSGGVARREE